MGQGGVLVISLVHWLTTLALVIALFLAVAWALTGVEIEPWVTLFALLAALLGAIVAPRLRAREQRRGLLRDLALELERSRQVFEDPKLQDRSGDFVAYPRFTTEHLHNI